MAEEDDFIPFEDISKLKKGLEGIKGKKDISTQELYEAVQKLAQTITDMLEVFGAAAEQLKLEEKEYDASSKKNEIIISRLDKLMDQNKTIAEAMVSVVEMIKEKIVAPATIAPAKQEAHSFFKPKEEPFLKPRPFMNPQPEYRIEPMMPRTQPAMGPMPPIPIATQPMPDIEMPPLEPMPPPDLELPEETLSLEEEPKKKGLFGMFKK